MRGWGQAELADPPCYGTPRGLNQKVAGTIFAGLSGFEFQGLGFTVHGAGFNI